MEKSILNNAVKIVWMVVAVLSGSSCGIRPYQSRLVDFPEDMPLSEFIPGSWHYEGKYYYEGIAASPPPRLTIVRQDGVFRSRGT